MFINKNILVQVNQFQIDHSSMQQPSSLNPLYSSTLEAHNLNPNINMTTNRYCNCKKSKCSKMYCECYLAGSICNQNCKCIGCQNDDKAGLVKRTGDQDQNRKNRATSKGCNCKKSECLKKYCECYNSGLNCTQNCKCEQCRNINFRETSQIQQNSESIKIQKQIQPKNQQFKVKLQNLMSSVPNNYQQSMMEFLFYVLS